MVKIPNNENKTKIYETSGSGQNKKIEILELKMKVNGIEEDEKKMLFALGELGDEGYEWCVNLDNKPSSRSQMKELLTSKWKFESEMMAIEQRRKAMEIDIEKNVNDMISQKMNDLENLEEKKRYVVDHKRRYI